MIILTDEDGKTLDIAAFVTHSNSTVRMAGRAIASGWVEQCRNWIEAELERDAFAGPSILDVLSKTFVQIYGGTTGSLLEPGGHTAALELFELTASKLLLKAAERAHHLKTAARSRASA